MEEKLRILILEDNAADAQLMVHELGHEELDFSCRCVETKDAFLKELDAFSPDLILADYTLPDFDAMHALKLVNERAPNTSVIIVTGSISEEVAVECMKAGAFDYVLKDHLIRLAPAVRAALDKKYEREQKLRAEKALRESEQRFRQLADSLPQLVWTCRSDGQCDYLSPQWVEYTGIPKAEQLGQGWLNQLHPDDREPTIALLNAATGASSFFEGEFRIRRHDGLYRWFKTRAVPLRSGEGRVVKWFGTNTDIETQKRAEGALRGSENKYRVLVENLPQKIFLKDRNSVYISCNENYAQDLKIEPEEIAGKTDYDFYPEELAEKYRADDQKIIESGKAEEIEEQYVQDGKEVFVHTAKTPIRDEQGHVSGILGIFWDITERRRADDALRESERKHRQLLETLREGIWAIDASAHTTFVNSQMAEMLGYTADEMLGRHLFSFMDEQGVEFAKQGLERRKAGIPEQHDFEFLRKDGTRIYTRLDTSPLTDKEGNYTGALASVTDMTEQRQLEAALRKDEERLRVLFDNLTIGVYRMTPEGKILTANPVFVKMLGCASFAELETRNLEEEGFNPTHPRSQFKELIEQKGEVRGFESAWRMRDGSVIFVRENARAVRGTDGKTLYYEGTAEDITERKHAEKALQESEARFQDIALSTSDWIWEVDAKGTYTFCSEKIERVLGYTPQEIIGKTPFDLMPPEEAERIGHRFREIADAKAPIIDMENWKLHKDGHLVCLLTNGIPVLDVQGDLIGYRGADKDITERKRAEIELQASQERLKEAQAIGNIGNWELDLVSGRVFWSDQMCRLYERDPGTEPLSLEGELATCCPEDMHLLRDAIKRAAQRGETSELDLRATLPSGTSGWHHGIIQPIQDEHGKVVRIVGTVQDITERKRAEEALRRSNVHLLNALRIAKLGNWEYDVVKDLFIFNDEFYALFRTTAEEVGGYTLSSARYAELFVHPEDVSVVGDEVRKAIEAADPNYSRQLEHRMVYADGEIGHIVVRFQIVKDSEGRTVKTYGVNQDITERKRAEEALRKRTYKLGERVKEQTCLYAVSNLMGMRDIPLDEIFRKIVDLIPSAWQYPEITCARIVIGKEEYRTDNFKETIWKQTSDINVLGDIAGTLEVLYLEEKPESDEGPFLKEERELIDTIARLIGKSIEFNRMERTKKKLEAQFRQAQKMEAIGTLAGGIAHDFNNILAAMIGYAEMAQKQMPESNITVRSDLDAVLQAGSRAKDLVKQILTFSRQTEQEPQLIQIYPVVKEALKLLRASLPTTIEILENIKTDCGVIFGDPTQIHQILMNLCSNALHAMCEKGGVLEVQLDSVEVDAKFAQIHPKLHEGPYVVLTVSDTGQGMDQTTMERIFEPFYTTKAMGEGTGMGLSTTHGIVMSHNGAITVQSELGKGSTFRVYLPKVAVETPETVLEEEAISGGKENILFVDDEERLADLGKKMLEHLGYNVTVRTSSIEALEVFRAQPSRFDLVITDQTMPKMTGIELATEMMRIRPDVPVILTTGYSAIVTPEKAKQLGIRECIMKPMLSAELGKIVRQVLDQERGESRIMADILVIDDDLEVRSMLSDLLQRAGYEVVQCSDGRAAMKVLRERQINIVITDIVMPEKEGIETIQELQQEFPEVKIVAISGGGRIGPSNYLSLAKAFGVQRTFEKPFDNDEMLQAVNELLYAESAES